MSASTSDRIYFRLRGYDYWSNWGCCLIIAMICVQQPSKCQGGYVWLVIVALKKYSSYEDHFSLKERSIDQWQPEVVRCPQAGVEHSRWICSTYMAVRSPNKKEKTPVDWESIYTCIYIYIYHICIYIERKMYITLYRYRHVLDMIKSIYRSLPLSIFLSLPLSLFIYILSSIEREGEYMFIRVCIFRWYDIVYIYIIYIYIYVNLYVYTTIVSLSLSLPLSLLIYVHQYI